MGKGNEYCNGEMTSRFYEQTLNWIIKCSKPKSSSNVNTTVPLEYNVNKWDSSRLRNYTIELGRIEREFIKSDKYSTIYTNLEKGQIELQDRTCEFSPKQEAYLSEYFGNGYKWINGILYNSPSFYNHFTSRLIKHYESKINSAKYNIDKSISNGTPLRQNTVLYSSLRLDDDLKVGDTSSWKGYVSTTFDEEQLFQSSTGKDYKVKILALKGVKGICGQGQSKHLTDEGYPRKLSVHPSEQEFLLGRNTNYIILSKNNDTKEATVLVY